MTSLPECPNCNGRWCMDCVLRYCHDWCQEDCPFCCTGAFKVLVTGSRDWPDKHAVWNALEGALADAEACGVRYMTVIHGAARGADSHAHEWCMFPHAGDVTVIAEEHPADWCCYGEAAGPIRNREMIARKPDLCLAFIKDMSRGASGCMADAAAAGIKTRVWRI